VEISSSRARLPGHNATSNPEDERLWQLVLPVLQAGGASPPTVIELAAALKLKEAAYLMAEGMSTEQMFHGPFQCASADDLFVLIAPAGAAQDRTLQLAGPIKEIGAEYVVVSDGTADAAQERSSAYVVVPEVPEPFTSVSCLMPLHLLTYAYAMACGTNPDSFHLDDERFMRAYRMNKL